MAFSGIRKARLPDFPLPDQPWMTGIKGEIRQMGLVTFRKASGIRQTGPVCRISEGGGDLIEIGFSLHQSTASLFPSLGKEKALVSS